MTKSEIEQAIKNGESVWAIYKEQSNIYEIKAVEIEKVLNDTFLWGKEYYANIKDVYKTKTEAEHYLNHANVERVEKLPFLTLEEFNEKKSFTFTTRNGNRIKMYISNNKIVIYKGFRNNKEYENTKQGFYKAYDECKKLFLGEL